MFGLSAEAENSLKAFIEAESRWGSLQCYADPEDMVNECWMALIQRGFSDGVQLHVLTGVVKNWFRSQRRKLWRDRRGYRVDPALQRRLTGHSEYGEPVDLLIARESGMRAAKGESYESIVQDGSSEGRKPTEVHPTKKSRSLKLMRWTNGLVGDLRTA